MQGEHVRRELGRLVEEARRREGLPEAQPVPGIPEARGFSKPKQPSGGSGTAGIASPLTVTAMSGASSMTLVSTDGFFVLNMPLTVDMTDAAGRAVRLKFPA